MERRSNNGSHTTVCCVCGGYIRGAWPAAGDLSHGYCAEHFRVALREVEKYLDLLDQNAQTEQLAHAA